MQLCLSEVGEFSGIIKAIGGRTICGIMERPLW